MCTGCSSVRHDEHDLVSTRVHYDVHYKSLYNLKLTRVNSNERFVFFCIRIFVTVNFLRFFTISQQFTDLRNHGKHSIFEWVCGNRARNVFFFFSYNYYYTYYVDEFMDIRCITGGRNRKRQKGRDIVRKMEERVALRVNYIGNWYTKGIGFETTASYGRNSLDFGGY